MWENKRFHSLSYYLKKQFGEKIYKVSLDGGFTCPNRDGTLGRDGCIFCSEKGSGEFAGSRELSIEEQIDQQLNLIYKKFPEGKVIAYFQNFTNTYASVKKLREIYISALEHPRVIGLAIATRPDCLSADIMALLEEINKKYFIWIELGLQSIHKESSDFINRGYSVDIYEKSARDLEKRKIKFVTHLILGLPEETKEDMMKSVEYMNKIRSWGVKLHLLHIIKGTPLYHYYKKNRFPLLEMEEYVSIVVEALEILNPNIVIHRITGDGSKDTLEGPLWSLDKRAILNGVDRCLKLKNSYQGCYYNLKKL